MVCPGQAVRFNVKAQTWSFANVGYLPLNVAPVLLLMVLT